MQASYFEPIKTRIDLRDGGTIMEFVNVVIRISPLTIIPIGIVWPPRIEAHSRFCERSRLAATDLGGQVIRELT